MAVMLGDRMERLANWLQAEGWAKLGKLLAVLITCLIILWGLRLISRALRRSMALAMGEDNPDVQRRAKTLGSVLENFARALVVGFFVLETLQEFNINVGPLVAGLGLVGAALGFGAQTLVRDIISGIFLLVEDQYSVGDIVSVGDKHSGVVERMTLRVTVLRDQEGRAHYLPNGSVSDVVVMSKVFAKALVDVEVSPEDDLDRVMAVLAELGRDLQGDLEEVLEPTEILGIEALGASSAVIRTLTKTTPGQQWKVAREFRLRIHRRFRLEGFRRPIPARMVLHPAAPLS